MVGPTKKDIQELADKLKNVCSASNIIMIEDKYKCDCGNNEFVIGLNELFCSECGKKNEHIIIEE